MEHGRRAPPRHPRSVRPVADAGRVDVFGARGRRTYRCGVHRPDGGPPRASQHAGRDHDRLRRVARGGTLVTGYLELVAQRFVLGLFLGGVFPVVVDIYTSLFDKRVCGKLAGFYNGTFHGSVVVLGLLADRAHIADWRELLLIGAVPPLLLAPLAFVVVPYDRRIVAPETTAPSITATGKLPMAELFAPALRPQTLLIALMVGLNFFGSQAFTGWQTTYLHDVAKIDAAAAKEMFGRQFAAAIVGGFAWGALADRFGRRGNALGFGLGALVVVLYVTVVLAPLVLQVLGCGCGYGLMVSASVVWGPWIAEMYPPPALNGVVDLQLGPADQFLRAADHRPGRGRPRARGGDGARRDRARPRGRRLAAAARDSATKALGELMRLAADRPRRRRVGPIG